MDNPAPAINLALYCAFAIPASVVDLRSRRIPDYLSIPGALALCASTAFFATDALVSALAAAVLCSGLFLALRRFTKGLGLGDVKFVALTGLACGLAGSAFALMLASASALALWAMLAALGKADSSTRIPFAPFIAFGTIVSAAVSPFLFG